MKRRSAFKHLGRVTAATLALTLAVTVQNASTTLAAWNDHEWVSAEMGTVNCAAPTGAFASRGEGRVLSGSLLSLDTDTVAEIAGVRVTNDGTASHVRPTNASPVAGQADAYADPLRVDVLNGLIGLDLTSVLQIPLDTDTGLIGQYGRAQSTATSAGAGGYVTDSGGINTDGQASNYPNLATLKLSTLLNSLGLDLGSIVGAAVDVELGIGAVAGRAALDNPCTAIWNDTLATAVDREYLAAGLTVGITSPVVSVLGTTVDATLSTLETTANGLLSQSGLLSGVTTTVVNAVASTLSGLTSLLAGIRVSQSSPAVANIASIDLDLSAVRALVDNPAQDPDGVLEVSLRDGTVTIDTAALLEATYPGAYSNGLNGLDPNTNPLADPQVLNTLTLRLTTVLQNLVTNIDTQLVAALDGALITTVVSVPFERCANWLVICVGNVWNPTGALNVTVTGTLADLLAGNVVPTVEADALLGPVIELILGSLISGVVSALTGTLGATIGGIVNNALRPIVTGLAPTLNTLTTPVINLVSDVYTELFLDGAVAITVNAQNDPLTGDPEPHDWASMQQGRYDVAALRIGVLDLIDESAVWLYLGRGSVGNTCSMADAPLACAGY